ncbi:MAG: GntR family transcriptional regulator [Erysipelotrichaceae bacterium]|jgi:GntR family transcriptional regulator|nr:GntR family transcriptional regulator [Erysipelotrichaceae bacterium]
MNENKPMYQQLAESIRLKIVSGEYPLHYRLPSEREMQKRYGLNRLTIRKALDVLIRQGYVETRWGSGTYVRDPLKLHEKFHERNGTEFSLRQSLTQAGIQVKRKMVKLYEAPTPDFVKGKYFGKTSWRLVRDSYAQDELFAVQACYFPYELFPNASEFDFGSQSLYRFMGDKAPVKIISTMKTVYTPPEMKPFWPNEDVIFYCLYEGYDARGELVEYTHSFYSPQLSDFYYDTRINM